MMKKFLYSIIITVFVCLFWVSHVPKSIFAEVFVVHANTAWQLTNIILRGNSTLTWDVKGDDYWSFNIALFPEGHNAEGIPVPALESYAFPGENIGMLLGKIGDGRIVSMGLSGSLNIRPDEGGEYLYLTINDDLIGKYGEGYMDNAGDILVTLTQTQRKLVKISLLFVSGCPGAPLVKRYIDSIIADVGIDAEVNLMLIENDIDARRLRFIGSPTVRVDGLDVEVGLKDSNDFGIKSRIYLIDGKSSNHPPKSMIEDAIKAAKAKK